ncbi:hypothetical protein EYF80_054396 [Liparis tanakae]|uniref:Uncharacterized protein n=1 Tax=Liparis tanakae TaxID=230148 RepID=A0A4Z2F2S6_9TELE|nr:hypothetical protein EYF80_054396 [Liparis tanakae]
MGAVGGYHRKNVLQSLCVLIHEVHRLLLGSSSAPPGLLLGSSWAPPRLLPVSSSAAAHDHEHV